MAKLSAAELAKREEIIQSMKKNKRSLVKRYITDKKAKGEEPVNPEAVIYGRATNIAKKVAETQMEKLNLKELVRAALMHEKKFPDLTGDGKVTKADILKGRGVDLKEGEVVTKIKKILKAYLEAGGDRRAANDILDDLKAGRNLDLYNDINSVQDLEDQLEYEGSYTYPSNTDIDLEEDLDLGHQDNEPHMLKGDLYRIGKYAMELYQMVDQFEGMGEVDFPHWWQSKIIKAKEMISSAKHYLDFETKEPEIDAMVGAIDMSGALDNVGVDEPSLAERIAKRIKEDVVKGSNIRKETNENEDILGDIISDMLKYKTEEEVLAYLKQKISSLDESYKALAKRIKEDVVKGSNVKKVGDDYRVLSGKTGKMWPQKYKTKKDAEDAIQAYHANKAKK